MVHPRLSVKNDRDLLITHEIAKREGFLFRLPQKTIASTEFQESFVVRTDLDVVPDNLIKRLQYELLSWPKIQMAGPVILINSTGIVIWWIPMGMRNEWLEKTVALGASLASSV